MKTEAVYRAICKSIKGIRHVLSQPKTDYLILATLGLYIFAVWFEGDGLYFGGDNLPPLNPEWNINHILYTWTDDNGGMPEWGFPYYFAFGFYYLLSKIGLSLPMIQRLLFYLNFTLPGLSMYYLASVVYSKIYSNGNGKRVACWIAALFYMFNPVILRLFQVTFSYGVAPFILACLIRAFDVDLKGKIKFSLLASLASFGFLIHLPGYSLTTDFMLVLLIYSLGYIVFNRRRIKQSLITCGIFASAIVLVNLWAVLPLLIQLFPRQALEVLSGLRTGGFPDVAQHSDAVFRIALLNYTLEGGEAIYFSPGIIIWLVNLFFVIAAFSALLLKRRSRIVYFFALISVVGIFISTGPNPPVKGIYEWMYENFVLFRGFRETGWAIVIVALGYAVLIGITISAVYRWIRESLYPRVKDYLTRAEERALRLMPGTMVLAVLILVLVNGWPLVAGTHYKTPHTWAYNIMHKIPASYYDLAHWFNDHDNSQDYRIMVFPDATPQQTLAWEDRGAFVTPPIIPYIVSKPIILSQYHWQVGKFPIVSQVYSASKHGLERIPKIAGLLNAKYFVVDGYDTRSAFGTGISADTVRGSALEFDGVDDYVEVLDTPSLYSNELTSEAWIRPASPPEATDFVPVLTKRGAVNEWSIGLYYGQVYAVAWNESGGATFNIYHGAKIENTNWHHIAFTTDGITAKTYLDGELQGWASHDGAIADTPSAIYIGREPTRDPPTYFNGVIDEVRILNRALSADEVKASYNHKQPATEDGVVALWRFDEESMTTATDDSSNGNDGVIYGARYMKGNEATGRVPLYHEEQSFGKLDVYSIDENYVFPRVYATSKIHLIDGAIDPGLLQFIETADFSGGKPVLFLQDQLTPSEWQFVQELHLEENIPEATFEQINPTRYVVHINSDEPFFLVLSTRFHPYWVASIDGQKVKEHLTANGYANAWYIGKTGSFDVTLEYRIQDFFHIAVLISLVTFVGCLGYVEKEQIASLLSKIRHGNQR